MSEFFKLPLAAIVALVYATTLGFAGQTLALASGLFRWRGGWARHLENIREALLLAEAFLLSVLMAQVRASFQGTLAFVGGFVTLRYAIFLALSAASIALCFMRRTPRFLAEPLALAVTLPIAEAASGQAFPWLFCAALLFFSLRAAVVCVRRYREMRSKLSNLSIKQAVDALHSGLLFFGGDGHIVLMNRRMQRLMLALTGAVQRNGNTFRNMLHAGTALKAPEQATPEGHAVYRLDDNTVWMFSEYTLQFGKVKFFQISSADITERWALTAALREQEARVKRRGEELTAAIANVESIRRDEELLRLRGKVHDVMAQRLALLMRALRANQQAPSAILSTYADDLLQEMREEVEAPAPANGFETLLTDFGALGISITLEGAPPETPHRAFFLDFVREGVTNAVRHGFATEVAVVCTHRPACVLISIIDNGFAPKAGIIEGGGITNMRRALEKIGGTLTVEVHPRFRLTACIETTEET